MISILKVFKALRIVEVMSKLGFVLIGAIFAIGEIHFGTVVLLAKITVYSFINALTIFSYNAWSGYHEDMENRRLHVLSFLSRKQLGIISLLLLAFSLCIILIHKTSIVFTALGVLFAWTIYSWPTYGLKGIPFGGLFISFITEILLFHLSYLFFADYSLKSVSISIYFAFLVTAGHALHEILDYEADRKSNIMTTATFLGKDFMKKIVLGSFCMAMLWICFIYASGIIAQDFFIIFFTANLISLSLHFYFIEQEKYLIFRKFYLSLYFISTAIWFCIHAKT